MGKGEILYITRKVPVDENTGSLKYSSQILRALCKIHEKVNVICEKSEEDGEVSGVTNGAFPGNALFYTYTVNPGIRNVFSKIPYSTAKFRTSKSIEILKKRLLGGPKIIFIESFTSTWAVKTINDALKSGDLKSKVVYITENEELSTRMSIVKNLKFKPIVFGHLLDLVKIYLSDRKTINIANAITSISSVDFRLHKDLYGIESGYVLPPIYRDYVKVDDVDISNTSREICLIGSFIWTAKKNNLLSFLKIGFKKLSNKNISIKVVGNIDEKFLERLRKMWPTVIFTGRVDQIEPHIETCRIGIIPEEAGGGFKLKSLQYIFNRKPIFALRNAIVDLPLENGKSIYLYDTIESMVDGIIEGIDNTYHLNSVKNEAFVKSQSFLDINSTVNILKNIESEIF